MFLINQHLFSNTPDVGNDVLFDALIAKANVLGYTLPSANTLSALNTLIKDMRRIGMIQRLDLFHVYASDLGDNVPFRLMNICNPEMIGTSHNNLLWSNNGSKGTGNTAGNRGYINTGFNPIAGAYNYTLNNASYGFVLYNNPTDNINQVVMGSSSATSNSFSWNRITPINNDQQRINNVRGGDNTFETDIEFSDIGLKSLSRIGVNIEAVSQHSLFKGTGSVGTLQNEVFNIHNAISYASGSIYFGVTGVSCAFAGASIPFETLQNFRQVYNKYLRSIGLIQVA